VFTDNSSILSVNLLIARIQGIPLPSGVNTGPKNIAMLKCLSIKGLLKLHQQQLKVNTDVPLLELTLFTKKKTIWRFPEKGVSPKHPF
jgi:hypothetical protein